PGQLPRLPGPADQPGAIRDPCSHRIERRATDGCRRAGRAAHGTGNLQRALCCDRQAYPRAAGEEDPARMIWRGLEEMRMKYCFPLILGLLACVPLAGS